jgi:cytidine deaminase
MPELAPATVERLIASARRARSNAHAPYSRYPVGAAVLCDDGRVFAGCNVENSSYGLSICAERNAIAATVTAGAIPVAVAVVTATPPAGPCGACLQVLAEFPTLTTVVIAGPTGPERTVTSMRELLPKAFHLALDEGQD